MRKSSRKPVSSKVSFHTGSSVLYRCLYVLGFFVATIADTSLIWLISAVTVALMTLPNLIGMLLMHKEVKQTTEEYWHKARMIQPDSPKDS